MSKPDDIPQDVWGAARASVAPEYDKFPPTHRDILSGEHDDWPIVRVAARAIMAEREACAAYIEGKGGVIPGAAVFAHLVSRNNQPCMSGDSRDRLHSHTRREFDDATASLAKAIRQRGEA